MSRVQSLVHPDEPWIWLVYLPLYFYPWLRNPFTHLDAIVAMIAIPLLLVVYLGGARSQGHWLIGCATVVLIESFVLAPLGGNWTIFTIYATAMIGRLRPPRQAIGLVFGYCIAASLVGLTRPSPAVWWLPGVFLAGLIGIATVSRTTLRDKNLALIAAQEEVRILTRAAERERITRDLHDLIGRTLTLIVVKADLAERLLIGDVDAARGEIKEIATAARESLVDVRQALRGMVSFSLAREVCDARDVLLAADIVCLLEGDADGVHSAEGAVLAMALREAVTNVVRHAGATRCRIGIGRQSEHVLLTVEDDGCGGTFREGAGLFGMRTRLTAAGGGLAVEPLARGTRITARMPAAAV